MTPKKITTAVLLAFVGVSLVYMACDEIQSRQVLKEDPAQVTTQPAETDKAEDARLIAYYLHRQERCKTCLAIESMAKKEIETSFSDQLASGEIVWKAVDYEEPENEHFVDEFELFTSSLVLFLPGKTGEESWRRLDDTWAFVNDETAFNEYVREQVTEMLEDPS